MHSAFETVCTDLALEPSTQWAFAQNRQLIGGSRRRGKSTYEIDIIFLRHKAANGEEVPRSRARVAKLAQVTQFEDVTRGDRGVFYDTDAIIGDAHMACDLRSCRLRETDKML